MADTTPFDVPHPQMTEEQVAFFAELQEQAVRRSERRIERKNRNSRRRFLIGYLALGLGTVFAANQSANSQHAGLVSSCQRVQILRAQSNISDAVSFRILSISAQRERQLAKTDNRSTRKAHTRSARLLEAQAGQLTITGLTNCPKAVDEATTYKFPVASPVGNPRKGKLSPDAKRILIQSQALLERERESRLG